VSWIKSSCCKPGNGCDWLNVSENDWDNGNVLFTPCEEPTSLTIRPFDSSGCSMRNTFMWCLQIMPCIPTGQLHCAHSESGPCTVYTLGRLFINATRAISSLSGKMRTAQSGIPRARTTPVATMRSWFLFLTKPKSLHCTAYQ
jgi:hypothetical protein